MFRFLSPLRRRAVSVSNSLVRAAVAGLVGACVAARQAPPPRSDSGIIRSYDTTRITEPVLANGDVDYGAALRRRYGEGVTNENNALVPIYEALGPEALDPFGLQVGAPLLGVRFPPNAKCQLRLAP